VVIASAAAAAVSFASGAALLGLATAATVQMAKKKPAVVWPLMGPYLCWLTFATALNAEILRLNPDVSGRGWCNSWGVGDGYGQWQMLCALQSRS
jgi:tryptophan-rich sensory protein